LEFRRYYAERGVERQRTTPYSPQQNGVVEWHNQSVVTMAWYMLKAKALPGYFWGEAASTVIYILNRSPTRALDWKTAYEAWHGELPTVHYFHTFGRVAYIKNMWLNLKKLDDLSRKAIFVGYESGSKVYCCNDPIDQCVIVSRNVIFDEAMQWFWGNDDDEHTNDAEPFPIEYTTVVIHAPAPASASPSLNPSSRSPPSPATPLARGAYGTGGKRTRNWWR
jgi:hypothetical protein